MDTKYHKKNFKYFATNEIQIRIYYFSKEKNN